MFFLMWLARFVSSTGSQFSGFGLGLWLYEQTGLVTLYGVVAFATVAPGIVAAPLVGVVVDRWDRRRALLTAELGGAACTLAMVLTVWVESRHAAVPLFLLAVAAASVFRCLGASAFTAATTSLVPPERLSRANGQVQFAMACSQIVAPAAGGILFRMAGPVGLLLIDGVSFALAIAVLLLLRIPPPATSAEGRAARGPLWHQIRSGWGYVCRQPGLLGLLLLFASVSFCLGAVQVAVMPLVLGFAGSEVLGTVLSMGGMGMLLGSVVMLAWGGPKQRVQGVFGFMALQASFLFLAALQPSTALVATGAFGLFFAAPIVFGCSTTIWQKRVPPDMQGRVFSLRTAFAGAALPLGQGLAGPLADGLFEPWMANGGLLASTAGRVIGTGAGRGAALMLVLLGALMLLCVAAASSSSRVRRVESPAEYYLPSV